MPKTGARTMKIKTIEMPPSCKDSNPALTKAAPTKPPIREWEAETGIPLKEAR